MNLKPVYRYQMMDNRKAVAIFYLVLVCVSVLLIAVTTLSVAQPETMAGSFGGTEAASMVFLFVLGLNSFKEPFLMMLQHGVSRKTMFWGHVLTLLTIAAGMALLDGLWVLALKAIAASRLSAGVVCYSLYEQVYGRTGGAAWAQGLLYSGAAYVALAGAGSALTALFYRLNKAGKVAVGAGVPVLLTIVLPLMDAALIQGRLSAAATVFLDYALGLSQNAPLHAVAASVIAAALCLLCRWLLTRRAVVRG